MGLAYPRPEVQAFRVGEGSLLVGVVAVAAVDSLVEEDRPWA